MLRSLMVLSLTCCLSAVCFAEESEDEAIAKARHLTEAAVQLRTAGRGELADQLTQEAEKLVRPANKRLAEKQAAAARLQEEIAELERKLQRPKEIAIRVRLLSVPAENWKKLQPAEADEKLTMPAVVGVGEAWLKKFSELEQKGVVKKQAETTLTTRDGEAASLENGGEFPIPVPGPKGVDIQWRTFGVRLKVLPVALGFERIRLQLMMEHSERDMDSAVVINGTQIPGLTTQKIHTECESRLGETTLVYRFHKDDEVVFGLVTPQRSEDALVPPGDHVLPETKPPSRR